MSLPSAAGDVYKRQGYGDCRERCDVYRYGAYICKIHLYRVGFLLAYLICYCSCLLYTSSNLYTAASVRKGIIDMPEEAVLLLIFAFKIGN